MSIKQEKQQINLSHSFTIVGFRIKWNEFKLSHVKVQGWCEKNLFHKLICSGHVLVEQATMTSNSPLSEFPRMWPQLDLVQKYDTDLVCKAQFDLRLFFILFFFGPKTNKRYTYLILCDVFFFLFFSLVRLRLPSSPIISITIGRNIHETRRRNIILMSQHPHVTTPSDRKSVV